MAIANACERQARSLTSLVLAPVTTCNAQSPSLVNLERCLTVLIPFVAYMLAQGLELSGVVAILFAGITSAHYTIKNLTHSARRFSLHFYKMLANVCEALVFVYIGALLTHASTCSASLAARLLTRGEWLRVRGVALCRCGFAETV